MEALETLSLDLLCQGFFVRGAIVRGPLYHDDHMIFGSALVRAFQFESRIARFPRIIITREVREDILMYQGHGKKPAPGMDRLRESEDGPMYLHVLRSVVALAKKSTSLYRELSEGEQVMISRYGVMYAPSSPHEAATLANLNGRPY